MLTKLGVWKSVFLGILSLSRWISPRKKDSQTPNFELNLVYLAASGFATISRKPLWIFSSNLPGNFALQNARDFLGQLFQWSPFPTERSTKTPQKFGAKFGAKFGPKNLGGEEFPKSAARTAGSSAGNKGSAGKSAGSSAFLLPQRRAALLPALFSAFPLFRHCSRQPSQHFPGIPLQHRFLKSGQTCTFQSAEHKETSPNACLSRAKCSRHLCAKCAGKGPPGLEGIPSPKCNISHMSLDWPTCTFQTCTLFSARFWTLTTLRLPSMPSFPPSLLSIASTLSESKWAITSPRKGQAMQKCHEEQSARSKAARLPPLDFLGPSAS